MLSCMSVGLGWGYNTEHVTCCPVCLWVWDGVELQHRPCDMLSCMSVELGLWSGGITTQTMSCDVRSRLSGWCCNMDPVMCCLVSLWEWGVCNTDCYLRSYIWVCGLGGMGFATQTLLCVVLSV